MGGGLLMGFGLFSALWTQSKYRREYCHGFVASKTFFNSFLYFFRVVDHSSIFWLQPFFIISALNSKTPKQFDTHQRRVAFSPARVQLMSPRFLTPPRAAYDDEAMMAFPPLRTPSALVGNQKPIIDRSSPTSVVSFNFDEGDAVGLGYHGGSLFQSTNRFEVNPPPLHETRYPSEGNPIVPGLGRHFLSAAGNSNQTSGFVPNLSPTDSSEASASANALRTTRSSRSDSSPRTPRNSASRNSGGTPPVLEPASATPTPQNLADNPERLAKVKTELCAYYEKGKRCPWWDSLWNEIEKIE